MKPKPMQRIALFVRADQFKKLNEMHIDSGAPVAELIRRAIDAYLKDKGK